MIPSFLNSYLLAQGHFQVRARSRERIGAGERKSQDLGRAWARSQKGHALSQTSSLFHDACKDEVEQGQAKESRVQKPQGHLCHFLCRSVAHSGSANSPIDFTPLGRTNFNASICGHKDLTSILCETIHQSWLHSCCIKGHSKLRSVQQEPFVLTGNQSLNGLSGTGLWVLLHWQGGWT
jgi:hypothetical protein